MQALANHCNKCDKELSLSDASLRGSVCSSCNVKRSTLSRMFGGWPVEAFRKLPEESQKLFWQNTSTSKSDLETQLTKQVVESREKRSSSGGKGEFLPTSVYRSRGYTEEQIGHIEQSCDSSWSQALNCWTYCLDVQFKTHEDIKKDVETELANLKNGTIRKAFQTYQSPAKKQKKNKKSRSSSSSSRSSSVVTMASEERDQALAEAEAAVSEKELKARAKEEARAKKIAERHAAQAAKQAASVAKKQQKAAEVAAQRRVQLEAKEKVKKEKED